MDGKSTNYSYNNSPITFKIEGGKSYTISFANMDSYTSPSPVSYTAISNSSRSLTATYMEKWYGVFIVGPDGKKSTISDWTGGSNATGVGLVTDNVSIIIAPKNWYTNSTSSDPYDDGAWNGNKRSAWGGYNKTVTGVKITTSSADAITDYAGSANTDAIISQLKGTTDSYSSYYTGAPAAEYCRAYSNGCKGVGQWYLPAAGEMDQIVLNKAAIEEALTAISGELFSSPGYEWTSTQYSPNQAWFCRWLGVNYNYSSESLGRGVRPVCAF